MRLQMELSELYLRCRSWIETSFGAAEIRKRLTTTLSIESNEKAAISFSESVPPLILQLKDTSLLSPGSRGGFQIYVRFEVQRLRPCLSVGQAP